VTTTIGRVELRTPDNLNNNLSYTFVHFERQATGEKVYDVYIVNLRNTYQFTMQFLLRAITQFDSSRRRVLGDFLASYELMPGRSSPPATARSGSGRMWIRTGRRRARSSSRHRT
jgi:hypothetical protein